MRRYRGAEGVLPTPYAANALLVTSIPTDSSWPSSCNEQARRAHATGPSGAQAIAATGALPRAHFRTVAALHGKAAGPGHAPRPLGCCCAALVIRSLQP